MGKRKSSKKPQGPKKTDPLPTAFTCLFCNHEKAVSVKLDKKAGIGELECKVCGQQFQTTINYLSGAVDVYGDWVDAADAVAKGGVGSKARAGPSRSQIGKGPAGGRQTYDDDDDNGGYEGEGIVPDDDEFDD